MAKVTTIAQLEQEVKKRINWSLRNQIAPLIKEEIKKSVDDEVYDVYDPTRYKRRKENGGLQDEQNMTEVFEDYGVSVYNDTSAVGKNFDPLDEKIEYGYGALDQPYNVGRPFMDTAQEYVNRRSSDIQRIIHRAINHGK